MFQLPRVGELVAAVAIVFMAGIAAGVGCVWLWHLVVSHIYIAWR